MSSVRFGSLQRMTDTPVTVCLPVADRATSAVFYRELLGREPFGEIASDGLPEPLQFAVNDGLRVMLIPAGGFGWVIGDHEVAPRGQSECLLSLPAADEAAVDALAERAVRGGGSVVAAPERKPWAYVAAVADPDGHLWGAQVDA